MFQKTRLKLTLVNSIVFIILIGTLSTIIYFYVESNLYRDVDYSLQNSVQRLNGEKGFDIESSEDFRTRSLIWDSEGNLYDNRLNPVENDEMLQFLPKKDGVIETITVVDPETREKISIRTITTKTDTVYGEFTVQFLQNVNSENEILSTLLIVLIVGSIAGAIFAVGAGYYLADRALIPIKAAWKKQQEFVSDASHELRTPLAVIQSKTDLLFRAPDATIEEKAKEISSISNEARRLAKLVSSLLTLARSDSNQIEVKMVPFSLSELLQEIYDNYSEIAGYQNKTIYLKSPENVQFIGDQEKIHQLLIILLDNALKFTHENGSIVIICSQSGNNTILQVSDNGTGIPPEQIPKVFDRFFQGDQSRTNREGAGLGLSIAKWIVEKHHGKIKVESKVDVGSIFTATFNQKLKAEV